MKKLILIALAAGVAAVPTGALAQVAHSGPGNVTVRHGGGFQHHRLQRGFFIPPMWFGPQFHVQNWQLYGFTPPPTGHRWVRYYDDAYLIDREGRVQDTRYGLDWDEYGERWDTNEGIPSYYGRGEWRPDERDYAWVEGQGPGGGEGWDYGAYGADGGYAYGGAPGAGPNHPPPPSACRPTPYPCGGYGYGYGYYGYGVAYPIIIETTVYGGSGCCAASACCYEEVVTEEVVETRPPRRHYRPPPRSRPRPRPPAGERG